MELSNAVWHKSSRSGHNACVEVAFVDGRVAIRNSRDLHGPVLVFTLGEWEAFVEAVRDGELSG